MAKYSKEQEAVISKFGDSFEGQIPRSEFDKFYMEFIGEYGTEFSERSLASKIRHMTYVLEPKGTVVAQKTYTPEDEAKIREMCKDPDNLPYQEDIADALGRDVKSIGGKLVSMHIYGVKKRDRKVPEPNKFSEKEEAVIRAMLDTDETVYLEDIAEKLGREKKQVQGKLASMKIKGVISKNRKAAKPKVYTDEVVAAIKVDLKAGMSLDDIAAKHNLNPNGIQTSLIRLGVIPKKGKTKFWDDEKVAKLRSLFDAGKTLDEIASALGTTKMVVGKQMKKDGLEFAKDDAKAA